MPRFHCARIMPTEPDSTWAAVVDFPSRPLYSQRYRRGEMPDGAEPEPGHRIDLQIARDRFTSVVTQARRPHVLAHRTTGPGFWVEFTYDLRVCDDSDAGYSSEDLGHAHLTITTEYGGWFGSLIAKLRPGACRRYVVDEMEAIAAAAESVVAEPVDGEEVPGNQP